jgi:glycosyltransferase involved in cell wall biosynthesis
LVEFQVKEAVLNPPSVEAGDRMTDARVLVIIPAYNEEQSIGDVLLRLKKVAPGYDRLVIDDGSRDQTSQVIKRMGEKQIRLPVNLGYGRALQTGMKYALKKAYPIIVCLDADGQHRPEDAPDLVQALLENDADMVIGSRFSSEGKTKAPIDRRIGQLLFSILTPSLVGKRIYDTTSGFKVMRASVYENLIHMVFLDFHIESFVRLSLAKFKIIEYPIIVEERRAGKSMHSYTSIFTYPLKTLLLTLVAAFDVLITRRSR